MFLPKRIPYFTYEKGKAVQQGETPLLTLTRVEILFLDCLAFWDEPATSDEVSAVCTERLTTPTGFSLAKKGLVTMRRELIPGKKAEVWVFEMTQAGQDWWDAAHMNQPQPEWYTEEDEPDGYPVRSEWGFVTHHRPNLDLLKTPLRIVVMENYADGRWHLAGQWADVKVITLLFENGLLERRPNDKQVYRISEAGRLWLMRVTPLESAKAEAFFAS